MRPFTEWRVYSRWRMSGRPIPAPPIVKQRIVKHEPRRYGLTTVVETGTFTGDMIAALLPLAQRLISIELDDRLFDAARRRFAAHPQVEILHGDSATRLPPVVATLTQPALFWLDGHYAGGGTARTQVASPILQEIDTLLAHPVPGHHVLIDDARQFVGDDGYPTVEALEALIRTRQPAAHFEVRDDIIRWVTCP
ncbi:MAG TPA: hypothetical protein VNJ03_14825 [Vicinamibacterales bacterium]|nr:hypothetical protein [Vicinamibacterales bacterium]